MLSFLLVQLSHPYMTTGKTIALTRWTFVNKVTSLLFNMLSRLIIGEGNGNPLQYYCLENPMDGRAWWATVHGVAKSRTRLNNFTFTFTRMIIAFLSRSKCLLISWLQSPSTVILEPSPKIKSLTVSIVSPSICHEVMGPGTMILAFWMLNFKATSFTFIKRLFSSSSLAAIGVVSSAYLQLLIS